MKTGFLGVVIVVEGLVGVFNLVGSGVVGGCTHTRGGVGGPVESRPFLKIKYGQTKIRPKTFHDFSN